jgi:esterase/lipase
MTRITLKLTRLTVGLMERLTRSRINLYGTENLSSHPTLYVVNHFTRFETFIVPYIIHKITKRELHSLAHAGLFSGALGEYLTDVGAVSTRHPMRNRMIISDLMTGRHDWVIYPEGIMMKSKQIQRHGKGYRITTPHGVSPPHTGAAVLALKASQAKSEYRQAIMDGREDVATEIASRYQFDTGKDLSPETIVIQPVTITYYPIRPGANVVKSLVHRFLKDVSPRVLEELEIEGNLLLQDTDISMTFGTPIPVVDFLPAVPASRHYVRKLIGDTRLQDMHIWINKRRLTRAFMGQIYDNTRINIDHVVCNVLRNWKEEEVSYESLHDTIYLAAQKLLSDKTYKIHQSLQEDLITLVSGESCPQVDDILELAEEEKIISRHTQSIKIDQVALKEDHSFHDIRLKNTVSIIANELQPVGRAAELVKSVVHMMSDQRRRALADGVARFDQELFHQDYEHYSSAEGLLPQETGAPYFLEGKSTTGIVLSHGYLGSPGGVRGLAEYLNGLGYPVYVVRMRGHGTAPANLGTTIWRDWYRSYLRGYAVMKHHCKRVIIGGFSTGGTLALMKAATNDPVVPAVFAINPPMKLVDIKSRLAPAVKAWNVLLERFSVERGQWEYVEHEPEYPETNYGRNYIQGVAQLEALMDHCRKKLYDVRIPTMILQGDEDPAVDPQSADVIMSRVACEDKTLVSMPFNRHVIIRGEGHQQVFDKIGDFVNRLA